VVASTLRLGTPADVAKNVPRQSAEANTFRVIFFILTFFSIGVLSNFKTLWQEGFGKLAAVYLISLFGFVVWSACLISCDSSAGSRAIGQLRSRQLKASVMTTRYP